MDPKRIIDDWIGSTEDAITGLQGWLGSLQEWKRNGGREHNPGDFMAAFKRLVELMSDEWADRNPCDIDALAAVVRGEDIQARRQHSWVRWSDGDREWLPGEIER